MIITRRLAATVLGTAMLSAGLAACGGDDDDATGAAASPETGASAGAESHRISVVYDEPRMQDQADAQQLLQLGGTDGVADGFSQNFDFPVDVTIRASNESGGGSPHYDPDTKTVTLYYDFVTLTGQILKDGQPDIPDEEFGKQLAATDAFILVHELGHAFVDIFEIPITGREEDSVDGLATFFMADAVDNGQDYAFDAARFFNFLQGYQGSPDAQQFADEHSLSIQRALDIVCKVAGSSDTALQDIAARGTLPEDRLVRCPAEYEQLAKAWRALLEPHLRTG